jgi:putative lipoic acid-binding regulatory protein
VSETIPSEELLEFPCHYTFKAVGLSGETFLSGITSAVKRHAVLSQDAVLIRPSGKGTYQAVSILVRLDNFAQLKDIYAGMKEVAGLKISL